MKIGVENVVHHIILGFMRWHNNLMFELDLRSITVMSGALALMVSVVLMFLRLSYPKSIRGLGLWSAAPALWCVASLFMSWRGLIPDELSVIAGNLLLLVGEACFYFGTQRFFGLNPLYKRWLGVLLVFTPLLIWFTWGQPSFTARTVLVTLVWMGISGQLIVLIWRRGNESFATRFTVVVLLVHLSVLLMRCLTAFLPLPGEDIFDPSKVQTLYIGASAFSVLGLGMGFILMASERLHHELEHAASHDSLTNALLRRTLIGFCEQELERSRRHGRNMVVLMLDIDHFKAINDSHGHQAGDRVLVDFVNRVTPLLRRSDQLGRFGGEEFVLLLPETSREEALVVAERIRVRVELPADDMPQITVSIGMTSNEPDDIRIDTLLARADKALYQAKDAGRNRVVAL
jgi:diguanylate cyclase (GGDEF)-like protein